MTDRALRPSDAVPSGLLTGVAFLQGLTGVMALSVPAQFFLWWSVPASLSVALVLLGALGLGMLGAARATSRGLRQGLYVGIALASLVAVVGTGIAAWCLLRLTFTLYLWGLPPVAMLTAMMGVVGRRDAERCEQARVALASMGASPLRLG